MQIKSFQNSFKSSTQTTFISPLSLKNKNIHSPLQSVFFLCLFVLAQRVGGKNPLSDEMVRFDWTEAANQERLAGKSLNDDRQD
jgi:hypothetical protein